MPKLKLKVSKKALEEASERGDFEEAPPGWYVMKLKSFTPGKSKAGNPQAECIYGIVGVGKSNEKPEKTYGQLWDYVQLDGEATEWKRAEFALAMGLSMNGRALPEFEYGEGAPGSIIGNLVFARVKADDDGSGNYRGKIAVIRPYSEDAIESSSEEEEEAYTSDESEEEAFDAEESGEEEEPVSEDEKWTKESLLALTNDELNDVVTEWEVSKDELKKENGGKLTKGIVINAILEAQEVYYAESGEAEGEDEELGEDEEIDPEDEPF